MTQTPSSSSSSSTTSTSTTSSTTTPQNTCQVTNSLTSSSVQAISPSTPAQTGWQGDILVISGYNSSSTSTATDFQQSDLTLLNFTEEGSSASAMTATTSNVLPVNTVGTLNLLPYYQPGSTTQVMNAYSLMVCQANNCFPVYTYGVMKGLKGFSAITVPGSSPCNASSAANAYTFLQNLMAFPSSQLAQQFTTALNTATSSTSSESVSTAINNFFSGTTDYQNVNFDVFTAVMSYGQTFPYVWANFETSYTYNFYTTTANSTASSSAGSTNVTVDEQVTSLGTVVFTLTNSAPSTLAEAMAAYTITWNPTGQSSVPLTLSDGQLVADNSAGFSGICLQCTFTDMAALTGNPADNGIPIQALTGTINGTSVLGTPVTLNEDVKAKISGDLNKAMTSTWFHALQMTIVLYMSMEVLVKLASWMWGKFKLAAFNGTNPPTDEEIAKANDELEENANEKLGDSGNNNEVKSGEDLPEAQVQNEATIMNSESEVAEAGEIAEQASEEEAQLQVNDNSEVQSEVNETDSEAEDLEEINPESADASSSLESLQSSLSSNQSAIESENEKLDMSSESSMENEEDTDASLADDEASDEEKESEDEDDDFADDAEDLADV